MMLHDSLIAKGFVPHHQLAQRKELSLKENRTKYVMNLCSNCLTVSFRVDGQIIEEGDKCDYVVLAEHDPVSHLWKEIFVELKGTDVEHAISQLEASLGADILKNPMISQRKARIVALSFPSSKSNPAVEKAKRRFQSIYNCELKSVKSGQPDMI